jgi:hypothetical protein
VFIERKMRFSDIRKGVRRETTTSLAYGGKLRGKNQETKVLRRCQKAANACGAGARSASMAS